MLGLILVSVALSIILIILVLLILPLRLISTGTFDADERRFEARATWFPLATLLISLTNDGIQTSLSVVGFKLKPRAAKRSDGRDSRKEPFAQEPNESVGSVTNQPKRRPISDSDGQERSRPGPQQFPEENVGRSEHKPPDDRARSPAHKQGDGEAKRRPGLLQRITNNRWYRLAMNAPLRAKIIRWARRLLQTYLRSIAVRKFELRITASLDDFEQTGKVAGYVAAAKQALQIGVKRPLIITFEPVFDRECLEVRTALELRTSVIRLMWPLIVTVVTFPILSAWFGWRAANRSRSL